MPRDSVGSEPAERLGNPHCVTLLGLCNDLLRDRLTVAAIVTCCAIGSAFVRIAQPRTYTAKASFVPDVVQPLPSAGGSVSRGVLPLAGGSLLAGGRLASGDVFGGVLPRGFSRTATRPSIGLASSLLPNAEPLKPLDSEFYRSLLYSHAFLTTVAGSRFTIRTPTGTRTGTAADIYGLPPAPAARRREDAASRLASDVEVTVEDSGRVELSVRTIDPQFALGVAARVLDALGEQNRWMSDARGAAQVADLARATAEARNELRVAEDELARYLASNRAFVTSSRVALEFRRRDADVVEKRQHYAELALQLERAKLDASRATQVISVVERPELPPGPDRRGLLRACTSGAVGGAALAVLIVLTSAHLRRLRAAAFQDLAMLEAGWRAARYFPLPGRREGSRRRTTVASGEAG